MEASRRVIQDILSGVMEECGEEPHVYFQPPESIKLVYPCIIYHISNIDTLYSSNLPYAHFISFETKYISKDSTSKVPNRLLKLPRSRFNTYYTAEKLHHYSYTISISMKEVDNETCMG